MSKDILNFINGEYVRCVSGKTYEKRNPVDNSLIGMVHEAGKPEVDAAVAAAKAALHGPWGKLSVVERCNMLDTISCNRPSPPTAMAPSYCVRSVDAITSAAWPVWVVTSGW